MKGLDEWLQVLRGWEADPDRARDAGWMKRLAYVAINAGLPIYENGVDDAGPDGWRRLAAGYEGGKGRGSETRKTEYKELPLPWVAAV